MYKGFANPLNSVNFSKWKSNKINIYQILKFRRFRLEHKFNVSMAQKKKRKRDGKKKMFAT